MARNLEAVDLHCHTLHSDGELVPAELFRRAEAAGLAGVALTDHADSSNLEAVIAGALRACEAERESGALACAAGIELTHVRPAMIGRLVERARELGAQIVVVHGESPVEPVARGTNRAAIEAGCDILAHPGLLEPADARAAAAAGVLLEISGRAGHSLANGHVARLAREHGALVVYGGDCHGPGDLRSPSGVADVLGLAGLSPEEVEAALSRGLELLKRKAGAA